MRRPYPAVGGGGEVIHEGIDGVRSDTELSACEAERTKVEDDQFTKRPSGFSETTRKPLGF